MAELPEAVESPHFRLFVIECVLDVIDRYPVILSEGMSVVYASMYSWQDQGGRQFP